MTDYIFECVRFDKDESKILKKILRNQKAVDCKLSLIAITMTMCTVSQLIERVALKKKIKELNEEIEELRQLESE